MGPLPKVRLKRNAFPGRGVSGEGDPFLLGVVQKREEFGEF